MSSHLNTGEHDIISIYLQL